jgi:hypothetical protein
LVVSDDFPVQPYIIDAAPSARTSYGGFQDTGIPDGIPQLEEYLSVYCSFAVSIKYTYSRLAMDKPHSISSFPSLILKYFSGKTLACCKLEVLHCFFFVSWGIYLCRSISQMDYGTCSKLLKSGSQDFLFILIYLSWHTG